MTNSLYIALLIGLTSFFSFADEPNHFELELACQISSIEYECSDEIRARSCLECKIQHEYKKLKKGFNSLSIDISDIAEYKALRFIDRGSWERAVESKTPIDQIYNPAPKTWSVWSQGEAFFQTLNFDEFVSSQSNKIIEDLALYSITQDTMKKYDDGHKGCPGEMRKSRRSSWYEKTQSAADKTENTINLLGDDIPAPIEVIGQKVFFMEAEKITVALKQWHQVKNELIHDIKVGNKTPLEAGALLQRHLVSIHPFHDGNGRVSRFIYDLISKEFDLPYTPAGDLWNDILSRGTDYVNDARVKTYNMLELLKACFTYHSGSKKNDELAYRCGVLPKVELKKPEGCTPQLISEVNTDTDNFPSFDINKDRKIIDMLKSDLSLSAKTLEHDILTYSYGQSQIGNVEDVFRNRARQFWRFDTSSGHNLGNAFYAAYDPTASSDNYGIGNNRLVEVFVPKGVRFIDTRGGGIQDGFDISLSTHTAMNNICEGKIYKGGSPFKTKSGKSFTSITKLNLARVDRCRKILNQALIELKIEFIAYKWGQAGGLLSGCYKEFNTNTAFVFLGKPQVSNYNNLGVGNIKLKSYNLKATDIEIKADLEGYRQIDRATRITGGRRSRFSYFDNQPVTQKDKTNFKASKFSCELGKFPSDAVPSL